VSNNIGQKPVVAQAGALQDRGGIDVENFIERGLRTDLVDAPQRRNACRQRDGKGQAAAMMVV